MHTFLPRPSVFAIVASTLAGGLAAVACAQPASSSNPLDVEDAPPERTKDGGGQGPTNPTQPDGGATCSGTCAIDVSLGGAFACALGEDKAVYCWGANDRGQTGAASAGPTLNPVKIAGIGAVKQITTGTAHACALTEDGRVFCWGDDTDGLVSGVANASPHAAPAEVKGFPSPVSKLAALTSHECAILASGEMWCWGANTYGQCGVAGTSGGAPPKAVLKPVKTLTEVQQAGSAQETTCALRASGEIHCLGRNFSGQLARGTSDTNAHPDAALAQGLGGAPLQIAPGNGYHVAVALKDGRVSAWGSNARQAIVADPGVTEVKSATVVDGVTSIAEVATGGYFSCARTTAGTVVCWGDGASGQLGIAPPDAGAPRPPPQTIAGVADAKRVAAGLSGFACAVTSAGQILCWGANDKGQLGRGSAGGFDRRPGPVKL